MDENQFGYLKINSHEFISHWVHLNHLSDPNFIKFVIKYKRYTFQLERNVLGHFCMLGTLPIRMISHSRHVHKIGDLVNDKSSP